MNNKQVPDNKKISKTKYLILISIFTTLIISIGIMTCIYDNVVRTYNNEMESWGYYIPNDPTDKIAVAYPNTEYMEYVHMADRYQYYRRSWGYTLCGLFAIADAVVVMLLVKTNRKNN